MPDLPFWAWLAGLAFWTLVYYRRRRFRADRTTHVMADRHRSIKGGF